MPKLCQIIALVTGKKSTTQKAITESYKIVQKPDLFHGSYRVYTPKNEEGETLPPETKRVQMRVPDIIQNVRKRWSDLVDTVATQDNTNCIARGTVEVDGLKIENVPVTHLLYLEKQLTDVITFLQALPTLPSDREWRYNENSNEWRADTVSQNRTTKVQEPVVLCEATDKHPAQTQLITKDIAVGTWNTTVSSGAIPANVRDAYVDRAVALRDAVRVAREGANQTEAVDLKIGDKLFNYILK